MSENPKPCRDEFEEWWWNKYSDCLFNKAWGQRIWEAAWNRRSGESDKDLIEDVKMGLRLLTLQSEYAALRAKVEQVRDELGDRVTKLTMSTDDGELREAQTLHHYKKALTRILDEDGEAPS